MASLTRPPVAHPGVYLQEIPMGSRTISGVATSVTAFVGQTPSGPLDTATTVTSWADFERLFGGVRADLALPYAVQDFFANGGRTAVIVRLGLNAAAATAKNGLLLTARSAGQWANDGRLSVTIAAVTKLPHGLVGRLATLGFQPDALPTFYSLTVVHAPGGGRAETREQYDFVSPDANAGPYRVDRVLSARSLLVSSDASDVPKLAKAWSTQAKKKSTEPVAFAGGSDGDALTHGAFFGDRAGRRGLYALEDVDLFNLLVIPPFLAVHPTDQAAWNNQYGAVYASARTYCRARSAMLVVDPPQFWALSVTKGTLNDDIESFYGVLGGADAANLAVYFPWLRRPNHENHGEIEDFAPGGAVAGVMARTDASRGVWKAPAGETASINGAGGLQVELTDGQNGVINLQGVNCLRTFPFRGTVVWGARTMRGAQLLNDEWKYVPVRRLALFLHESLVRGSRWAVFEPNDENLWSSLRASITSFMQDLQRQGAFYGFFVRCDASTTTPQDIELGVVNVVIGFAPVKPAEFVVLHFQQQTASN